MDENNSTAPTFGDFLEEGRALEAAVEMSGRIHQQESPTDPAAILECRDLAVGILAITHSAMGDILKCSPLDPQIVYCLACTVAFAQGAVISSSLIAQAQYMKAAAALKQDIELLARIREIVAGRAVPGRTPQVSFVPEWARRAYGELNKIAHPSNFEEMHSVLSFLNGDFSILPLRHPETESALYLVHVWNCIEISQTAVELLAILLDMRPAKPEAKTILEASLTVLSRVFEKANQIAPQPAK
jgi:hypothetical protein